MLRFPGTQIALALAAGSIVFFIAVISICEQIGVPRGYSLTFIAITMIGGWLFIALSYMATSANHFMLADNNIRTTSLAFTLSAVCLLPPLLSLFTYLAISAPDYFVLIAGAMILGASANTFLFSRQMRNGQITSAAHLLVHRYQSVWPARINAIAIAAGGGLLFIPSMAMAAMMLTWFFGWRFSFSIQLVGMLSLISALSGGLASTLRLMAIAGILFIIALNIPLAFNAINHHGFPIGQFGFGHGAIELVRQIEVELLQNQIARFEPVWSTELNQAISNRANGLIFAAIILAGFIAFPLCTQLYPAARMSNRLHRLATKNMLFFAFGLISLLALLSFTKLAFYREFFGVPVERAKYVLPVLVEWSDHLPTLIKLCDQIVRDQAQILAACGSPDHVINISDIKIDGRLMLVASAALANLPFALTALLAVSLALVSIAFCALLSHLVAANLVSAFASKSAHALGKQLFGIRLIIILVTLGGVAIVSRMNFNWTELILLSLGIFAATTLPSLLGALYYRGSTAAGSIMAAMAGLAITLVYWFFAAFGPDLIRQSGDETSWLIPGSTNVLRPEFGAILALPAAIIVLVFVSLISRRHIDKQGIEFAERLLNDDAEDADEDFFAVEEEIIITTDQANETGEAASSSS